MGQCTHVFYGALLRAANRHLYGTLCLALLSGKFGKAGFLRLVWMKR
jgi:hypothetical protein